MIIMSEDYQEFTPNVNLKKREEYRGIAKGLQEVEGHKTSDYLDVVIKDIVENKYNTVDAIKKLERYYEENGSIDGDTREADLVAINICGD